MTYGKAEVVEFLNERGTSYEIVEHEAVFTMETMAALNLPFGNEIVKNLFLRDDKKRNFYLVVMPEDKPANLKALRKLIESRPLRFASAEDLEEKLGLIGGAVSPFGILNNEDADVHAYFDEELKGYKGIGVHPNDNTATLHISLQDMIDIITDHGNDAGFVDMPWPEPEAE